MTTPSTKRDYMAFFVDTSLILDTSYLVEAHGADGAGQFDGMYLIFVTLRLGETFQSFAAIYPSQAARDAAMVALGERCTDTQEGRHDQTA